MRLFKRSGTLKTFGVAASFFLFGCQTTDQSLHESEEGPSEVNDLAEDPPREDVEEPSSEVVPSAIVSKPPEPKQFESPARSLTEQAEMFGAQITRGTEPKTWSLVKGERVLVLKEKSRIAVLDGIKVFLDFPLEKVRGEWLLSETDQNVVLESAFGTRSAPSKPVTNIVIDPGHGGSRDGTKSESLGVVEKELTLDVSLRLQTHLEEAGFKVVLTRYDDRHVELEERALIANRNNADLFLSVHFNAAVNNKANGLETYLLTPEGIPSSSAVEIGDDAIAYAGNHFDAKNFEFAFRIQDSLLNRLGREDRGVKKARFRVLKSLNCPGALVECGFVSNEAEGLLISTAGYRERVAQALADAIIAYSQVN